MSNTFDPRTHKDVALCANAEACDRFLEFAPRLDAGKDLREGGGCLGTQTDLALSEGNDPTVSCWSRLAGAIASPTISRIGLLAAYFLRQMDERMSYALISTLGGKAMSITDMSTHAKSIDGALAMALDVYSTQCDVMRCNKSSSLYTWMCEIRDSVEVEDEDESESESEDEDEDEESSDSDLSGKVLRFSNEQIIGFLVDFFKHLKEIAELDVSTGKRKRKREREHDEPETDERLSKVLRCLKDVRVQLESLNALVAKVEADVQQQ